MSAKTVLLLCAFAFHLDTVTLQTTPEPYCVYNNVRHEVGSTFQTDTCTEGYCGPEGEIAEGTNCCEYNNKTYTLGDSLQIDPCTEGYCDYDGQFGIAVQGCPVLPCPNAVHVTGECCEQCPAGWEPSCTYQGKPYKVGPVPTEDPCQVCECPSGGGDVQCYKEACAPCHDYEDYVWVDGQCCPECRARPTTTSWPEDDNYEPSYERTTPPSRQTYEYYESSGERNPPPSRQAYDYYGPSAERTPPPSRQAYYYYEYEPTYEPIPESPPPSRAACYYEGQPYEEGPVPSNDRCVECECPYGGGDVRCYSGYCPRCPDSAETVTVPEECCPVCRERPTPPSPQREDDYYVPTSEQPTPTAPQPEDDYYGPTSEQPTPTQFWPEDDNQVPTAESTPATPPPTTTGCGCY